MLSGIISICIALTAFLQYASACSSIEGSFYLLTYPRNFGKCIEENQTGNDVETNVVSLIEKAYELLSVKNARTQDFFNSHKLNETEWRVRCLPFEAVKKTYWCKVEGEYLTFSYNYKRSSPAGILSIQEHSNSDENAYYVPKATAVLTVKVSDDDVLSGTEVTPFEFHDPKLSYHNWFTETSVRRGLSDSFDILLHSSCQM